MFARILMSCLLLIAPLCAFASGSWNVTNTSNQTLKFETFEPVRGTWKGQTIYPNQPMDFTMTGNDGKFRIATQNRGFVEYKVVAGGRYTLGWDQAKGVWDLKFAKGPGPANPAPTSAALTYELKNSSNQTLNFETLDPSRGTWKKQTAYPNESKSFSFAAGVRDGKIRIVTQGRGFVEYDVHAGWKYNLIWDQGKGVWDFRTLKRAG